jgi:F-type H+-transporting ATPase subunit epsilon
MPNINLQFLSPDQVLFDGEVTSILLTTTDGKSAYLNNHWNSIVQLDIGLVTVTLLDNTTRKFVVNGGIASFLGNTLRINTIESTEILNSKVDTSIFPIAFAAQKETINKEIKEALEKGGVYEPDQNLSALLSEERQARIQTLMEMIKGEI